MYKFSNNAVVACLECLCMLAGAAVCAYAVGLGLGMSLNTIERLTKDHPSVFVEPLETPKKDPFNNLG